MELAPRVVATQGSNTVGLSFKKGCRGQQGLGLGQIWVSSEAIPNSC